MDAATAEKMLEDIFEENGVLIDDKDDLLIDYIPDSLTYVNIIIGIEEAFDIEFPDEMLRMDTLGTFHNLTENVSEILRQTTSAHAKSASTELLAQN